MKPAKLVQQKLTSCNISENQAIEAPKHLVGRVQHAAYLTFIDGHFICEPCKIIAFLCEIQFIHLKFTGSIEIAFKN